MRFSSGKINNLLGLPSYPNPGEFYLIEGGATSLLYFCDTSGNLILLNESAITVIGVPVVGETPSGTINGINNLFTLVNTPIPGTLEAFLNGLRLSTPGDYSVVGSGLTMINIPHAGDKFTVNYRY